MVPVAVPASAPPGSSERESQFPFRYSRQEANAERIPRLVTNVRKPKLEIGGNEISKRKSISDCVPIHVQTWTELFLLPFPVHQKGGSHA